MYGRRFEKELKLITDALASEHGEQAFRAYLSQFVSAVVDKYITDHKIEGIPKETLMNAGWRYFPNAIRGYKERADQMLQGKHTIYYFHGYFNWFIRQALLEYLKSLKVS